jgi:hypothetical protein
MFFFKKKQITEEEAKRKNFLEVLKRIPKKDRIYYVDYFNNNILCPMRASEIVNEKNKIIDEMVEKQLAKEEEDKKNYERNKRLNSMKNELKNIYDESPDLGENGEENDDFDFDDFFNSPEQEQEQKNTNGEEEEENKKNIETLEEKSENLGNEEYEATKDIDVPTGDWEDDSDNGDSEEVEEE